MAELELFLAELNAVIDHATRNPALGISVIFGLKSVIAMRDQTSHRIHSINQDHAALVAELKAAYAANDLLK